MDSFPVKAFAVCAVALSLGVALADFDLPRVGNDRGYAPEQPIPFSHRLHAGELNIDCLHCHAGAETSRTAGIPPAELCMSCHAYVGAPKDAVLAEASEAKRAGREARTLVSPPIAALRHAAGRKPDGSVDPDARPGPLRWIRVHDLPDHATFDHRRHVARGVECRACHGAVETMERVRQEASLTMGWCVDCHRANAADGVGASPPDLGRPRADKHVGLDCATCHF
jgi:hypothetical protein